MLAKFYRTKLSLISGALFILPLIFFGLSKVFSITTIRFDLMTIVFMIITVLYLRKVDASTYLQLPAYGYSLVIASRIMYDCIYLYPKMLTVDIFMPLLMKIIPPVIVENLGLFFFRGMCFLIIIVATIYFTWYVLFSIPGLKLKFLFGFSLFLFAIIYTPWEEIVLFLGVWFPRVLTIIIPLALGLFYAKQSQEQLGLLLVIVSTYMLMESHYLFLLIEPLGQAVSITSFVLILYFIPILFFLFRSSPRKTSFISLLNLFIILSAGFVRIMYSNTTVWLTLRILFGVLLPMICYLPVCITMMRHADEAERMAKL